MKINHYYDVYNRTEPAIIYLAKPGKRILCALGGIDTSSVSLSLNTNNTAELSFTVDKYVDEMVSDGYEELDEFMELFCDESGSKSLILQISQMMVCRKQKKL